MLADRVAPENLNSGRLPQTPPPEIPTEGFNMQNVITSNFIRDNYPATARSMANRKLFLGFGVNDSDYTTRPIVDGSVIRCPAYSSWSNMITRCFCEKYKNNHPTYHDASICDEWSSFMAFRSWWVENQNDGWELDKDILHVGNKIYSPSTCMFIPCWINTFTVDCRSSRGAHPIGAYFCKSKNKFSSKCRHPLSGVAEFLGYFDDAESASMAWRIRKLDIADSLKTEMDLVNKSIHTNVREIIEMAL